MESSLKKKKKKYDDSEKRGEIIFFCSCSCTGIYANQVRHNSPRDGLKPYQRRTKKIEELLGEKLSTAKLRLSELLMFDLAKKCGMDTCFRCGEIIDNIAFSHAKCNYEVGTKTYVSNCKNIVKQNGELYTY